MFHLLKFEFIIFIHFFIASCLSDTEYIGGGGIGEVENAVILPDCLKSPESVPIECHLVNVKSYECIQDNVLSVPNIPGDEDLGEIKCTSSLPVDLSFEGYQLNDFIHPSFVRHTENVFVNDTTFTYSVSFPIADLKASTKVVLSEFDNPKQKMTFFLFRPGTSIFSSNYKPDPGASLNQTSPLVLKHPGKYLTIPCIPNDPNITVTLEVPANMEHLKPSYDNMKGFTMQTDTFTDPSGRYVCKAGLAEGGQVESAVFNVQPKSGSIYEPPSDKIFLFHSNSKLHVSCRSTQDVMVAGLFQGRNIISRENGTWSKIQTQNYPPYVGQYVEQLYEAPVGASGIIQCKTNWMGFVLKTWDIEVLNIYNNSVLQINKISEKKIACQSDTFPIEDIKLQLIFCQGETGCKLNEFCFDDKEVNSAQLNMTSCPKTTQYSAPCKIPESPSTSTSSVCLELPQNDLDGLYSQGMIRCTAGPHSYQTSFFVGFDGILYLDWKQAPISALVTILTPKEPLYAQSSYPFGCKAAKFLSDGRLQWMLREDNGSETILHNRFSDRIQDVPGFYATERDHHLYTVRESNIRLVYPNVSDLICMVPQWNGAGWTSLHKRINVTVRPVDVIDIPASNTTTIIAVSASVVVVLLGVVFIVIWRLIKAKNKIRNLTDKEFQNFMEGDPQPLENVGARDAHELVEALPYNKKFEIPRERLLIQRKSVLGRGASGIVYKGSIKGVSPGVAVKTVNSDCEVKRFKGFLNELKIMIYVGKHPNIVSLVGAHTEKIKEKILYIVIELCPGGSLEGYLRNHKSSFVNQIIDDEIKPEGIFASQAGEGMMTTVDLLKWSYQVANGMEYLGMKKVIHGDVAARNILIDQHGNAKITDFGLSRRLFEYEEYVKKHQENMPWRYLSIESLQEMRFSAQSDVWAYGVLLWEIYSIGEKPYPGISWSVRFVQLLKNGVRMIKPDYCTNGIYELMLSCWNGNPEERPLFSSIIEYFKSLLGNLDREYMEMEVESQVEREGENTFNNDGYGKVSVPGHLLPEQLEQIAENR